MTIDEFMRDIAPKMHPGWVAMSKQNLWWYFRPVRRDEVTFYEDKRDGNN